MNQHHEKYNSIKNLVIEDLKEEAKELIKTGATNLVGDGYLTDKQYKNMVEYRKKRIKGAKMLLDAFKILKY